VTSRFVSNLIVLLAGAALAVASFAFDAPTTGWLMLGLACLAAVTVLVAFPLRGRGPAQRCLDALVLVAAAWAIVASRAFDGSTLTWLAFSTGATFATLATAGMIAHEVRMERAARALQPIEARDAQVTQLPDRPRVGVAG
jgi:cation transport ATPase